MSVYPPPTIEPVFNKDNFPLPTSISITSASVIEENATLANLHVTNEANISGVLNVTGQTQLGNVIINGDLTGPSGGSLDMCIGSSLNIPFTSGSGNTVSIGTVAGVPSTIALTASTYRPQPSIILDGQDGNIEMWNGLHPTLLLSNQYLGNTMQQGAIWTNGPILSGGTSSTSATVVINSGTISCNDISIASLASSNSNLLYADSSGSLTSSSLKQTDASTLHNAMNSGSSISFSTAGSLTTGTLIPVDLTIPFTSGGGNSITIGATPAAIVLTASTYTGQPSVVLDGQSGNITMWNGAQETILLSNQFQGNTNQLGAVWTNGPILSGGTSSQYATVTINTGGSGNISCNDISLASLASSNSNLLYANSSGSLNTSTLTTSDASVLHNALNGASISLCNSTSGTLTTENIDAVIVNASVGMYAANCSSSSRQLVNAGPTGEFLLCSLTFDDATNLHTGSTGGSANFASSGTLTTGTVSASSLSVAGLASSSLLYANSSGAFTSSSLTTADATNLHTGSTGGSANFASSGTLTTGLLNSVNSTNASSVISNVSTYGPVPLQVSSGNSSVAGSATIAQFNRNSAGGATAGWGSAISYLVDGNITSDMVGYIENLSKSGGVYNYGGVVIDYPRAYGRYLAGTSPAVLRLSEVSGAGTTCTVDGNIVANLTISCVEGISITSNALFSNVIGSFGPCSNNSIYNGGSILTSTPGTLMSGNPSTASYRILWNWTTSSPTGTWFSTLVYLHPANHATGQNGIGNGGAISFIGITIPPGTFTWSNGSTLQYTPNGEYEISYNIERIA